jgi:hypothetical protein
MIDDLELAIQCAQQYACDAQLDARLRQLDIHMADESYDYMHATL